MSVLVKINAPSPQGSEKPLDGENVFGTWRNRRQSVVSSNQTTTDEEPKTPSMASFLRRRSTFKGIAGSLLSMRRMTKALISEPVEQKPKIRMENTYRMDPNEDELFRTKRVQDTVHSILAKELCNEKYNPARSKNLACDLSVLIKNRVKDMGFPRYRIICNVVIGQCLDQGVEMASQCVWSPSTDNFACSSYKNTSLFAVALVHAVYYE